MNLQRKSLNYTNALLTGRVAVAAAEAITGYRQAIASRLNASFNALPDHRKKLIMLSLGCVAAAMLCINIPALITGSLKRSACRLSAHIGAPSGMPAPKIFKRQLTDSIIKKQH